MNLTRKPFSLNRAHEQLMQAVDYAGWLKTVLLMAALVLVLPLGVGCVSVAPPSESLSGFKEKDFKNFQLNQYYAANVGEPIVTRQKYRYKELSSLSRATSSSAFQANLQTHTKETYKGRRDEEFQVAGTTKHNGKDCHIVVIPFQEMNLMGWKVGILVYSDSGEYSGVAVFRNGFGKWVTVVVVLVKPSDVRFPTVLNVEIDRASQYENYEIIYTGKNGDNINLVYREFTHTDLARPSFYQNLTYNMAESKTIRFRKLQMEIKEASNQLITLKVVSDN